MCEGRRGLWWTVLSTAAWHRFAPRGSPVLGLTSNLGKLLLEMSSRIRWPRLNRLAVGKAQQH